MAFSHWPRSAVATPCSWACKSPTRRATRSVVFLVRECLWAIVLVCSGLEPAEILSHEPPCTSFDIHALPPKCPTLIETSLANLIIFFNGQKATSSALFSSSAKTHRATAPDSSVWSSHRPSPPV